MALFGRRSEMVVGDNGASEDVVTRQPGWWRRRKTGEAPVVAPTVVDDEDASEEIETTQDTHNYAADLAALPVTEVITALERPKEDRGQLSPAIAQDEANSVRIYEGFLKARLESLQSESLENVVINAAASRLAQEAYLNVWRSLQQIAEGTVNATKRQRQTLVDELALANGLFDKLGEWAGMPATVPAQDGGEVNPLFVVGVGGFKPTLSPITAREHMQQFEGQYYAQLRVLGHVEQLAASAYLGKAEKPAEINAEGRKMLLEQFFTAMGVHADHTKYLDLEALTVDERYAEFDTALQNFLDMIAAGLEKWTDRELTAQDKQWLGSRLQALPRTFLILINNISGPAHKFTLADLPDTEGGDEDEENDDEEFGIFASFDERSAPKDLAKQVQGELMQASVNILLADFVRQMTARFFMNERPQGGYDESSTVSEMHNNVLIAWKKLCESLSTEVVPALKSKSVEMSADPQVIFARALDAMFKRGDTIAHQKNEVMSTKQRDALLRKFDEEAKEVAEGIRAGRSFVPESEEEQDA